MRLSLQKSRSLPVSILLIFLVCGLVFVKSVSGQETTQSKWELVEEYSGINYELLRSSVDRLLSRLINDPDSTGVIVIYEEIDNPLTKFKSRLLHEAFLDMRFSGQEQDELRDRLKFLQGDTTSEETKAQYWIGTGSEAGFLRGSEEWDYGLSGVKEPTLIFKCSWMDDSCPGIFTIDFFSSLLNENKDTNLELVIREKSYENNLRVKRELIQQFVETKRVSIRQLIFDYCESENSDIEYWLL